CKPDPSAEPFHLPASPLWRRAPGRLHKLAAQGRRTIARVTPRRRDFRHPGLCSNIPEKILYFNPNTRQEIGKVAQEKARNAMPQETNLLALTNLGHVLDHPEAVAWGPDQKVYAGGEEGQIYRFSLADRNGGEFARIEGGFVLGMAH